MKYLPISMIYLEVEQLKDLWDIPKLYFLQLFIGEI